MNVSTTAATSPPRGDYAFAVALQALVYTFPLVEMVRTRAAVAPRRNRNGQFAGDSADAPMRWSNVITHSRKLLGAGESRVVLPNNDLLYTIVWFDLSGGPQVLHVPDTLDRYYVLGFLDMYTNPFAHIGRRTTGTGEGLFLIAGPDWIGDIPDGMHLVHCPTNWIWMIGRILVDGADDVSAVHALQDQFSTTPLDAWRHGEEPGGSLFDAWIDHNQPVDNVATHLKLANRALRQNPGPTGHDALVATFAEVGIGPNQPENIGDLPKETVAALERAYVAMREIIAMPMGQDQGTCWRIPFLIGTDFGHDWLTRAAVAHKYIGALCSDEAIYPTAETDAEGLPLCGKHKYRMRFEAGQLPPVDCFWSLSLYGADDFKFTSNSIGRYSIGDRTAGLNHDADGGLTICIQNDPPPAGANWLPAPPDGFLLCLRAYQPRPSMLDGSYRIPSLKRLADL
jgi:hypothetical protein